MSETRFTPGTWAAESHLREPGMWTVVASDLFFVASVAKEADAHLIAAAPDLYRALEAFAAVPIEGGDPPDDVIVRIEGGVIRRARAALAKARGETP